MYIYIYIYINLYQKKKKKKKKKKKIIYICIYHIKINVYIIYLSQLSQQIMLISLSCSL